MNYSTVEYVVLSSSRQHASSRYASLQAQLSKILQADVFACVCWMYSRCCALRLLQRAHRRPAGTLEYSINVTAAFPFHPSRSERAKLQPCWDFSTESQLLSGMMWNYPHRVHNAWHTASSRLSVVTVFILPRSEGGRDRSQFPI